MDFCGNGIKIDDFVKIKGKIKTPLVAARGVLEVLFQGIHT